MKKSYLILLMALSPLSFGADLLSSTKQVAKFLNKPDVGTCEELSKAQDDVENSEVKLMYPCAIWDTKKDILDKITDKKKIYIKNGKLLTDAEVDALDEAAKDAAEKKVMMEKSDIFFSKISPIVDLNGDGKSDIVIRSRSNETTGEKDYTIKLRPMEPKNLNLTGVKEKNVKCERDVSSVNEHGEIKSQASLIEDSSNISCSQTINETLSQGEESKKFLRANRIELHSIVAYPAIKSEKRGIKAVDIGFAPDYLGKDESGKDIKLKISLEKWQVPGLTAPEGCFLELSAKSPVSKMNHIGADLKAKFEIKLGVSFDKSVIQGNKTGQALKLIEQK